MLKGSLDMNTKIRVILKSRASLVLRQCFYSGVVDAQPTTQSDEVFVVAPFVAPHWPEGLTIDKRGNIYGHPGLRFLFRTQ